MVACGPNLVDFFFETFKNSGKVRFLAAILANIGLSISQANLELDAAQFRVLTNFVRRNQRQHREL